MDNNVLSEAVLQKLIPHPIHITPLKGKDPGRTLCYPPGILKISEGPVLAVHIHFGHILLRHFFHRINRFKNRLILMDGKFRNHKGSIQPLGYCVILHGIHMKIRKKRLQPGQDGIAPVKSPQIVPVSRIVHLVKYRFSLCRLFFHQRSIVNVIYSQFIQTGQKLLNPAGIIVNTFSKFF